MDIHDASPYDLFSATIDGEFSAEQIKKACEALDIPESQVLGRGGDRIVEYLMRESGEIA